jgi:glycosyltransferase involved in cell wall biosynthesis
MCSAAGIKFISTLSRRVGCDLTDSWHWKGYEAETDNIYRELDLCVMPSSNESFGLVATEASAHELPIIVSNRGGLAEVVEDGVTGLLIDPDDPTDLAAKIAWLLDNPDAAQTMALRDEEGAS